MKIVKFSLNDVLELKKPHPCGSHLFTVLRVGSDVRICCRGCGRDMSMAREKLEHSVRAVQSADNVDQERENP